MRIPRLAPLPMPATSATGVAKPSAHGHATTRTVTAAMKPPEGLPAISHHPTNVSTASAKTIGTKTPEIRSTSRTSGVFSDCACAINLPIAANVVSSPAALTRTSKRPDVLMVAPVTSEPGETGTGTDSPVIIEASTSESPSVTTPSAAIFSPGRTKITVPTVSSSAGTSRWPPSASTTVAWLAPSSSSARVASAAPCRARDSSQRPSSKNVTMTAADSKYRWCPCIACRSPSRASAVSAGSRNN